MKKFNTIKNELGDRYIFEKCMNETEISKLLDSVPANFSDSLVSSLTAGCVKIEAVIFKTNDNLALGYDVFVKDHPDSDDWICYDNPSDLVCIDDDKMEKNMFSVLDKVVENNGLSYTECDFEVIDGKAVKPSEDKQGYTLQSI